LVSETFSPNDTNEDTSALKPQFGSFHLAVLGVLFLSALFAVAISFFRRRTVVEGAEREEKDEEEVGTAGCTDHSAVAIARGKIVQRKNDATKETGGHKERQAWKKMTKVGRETESFNRDEVLRRALAAAGHAELAGQ
jgi:hypothetical protein